jgi:hypothetical protein
VDLQECITLCGNIPHKAVNGINRAHGKLNLASQL